MDVCDDATSARPLGERRDLATRASPSRSQPRCRSIYQESERHHYPLVSVARRHRDAARLATIAARMFLVLVLPRRR
jgi:hypothetical protein